MAGERDPDNAPSDVLELPTSAGALLRNLPFLIPGLILLGIGALTLMEAGRPLRPRPERSLFFIAALFPLLPGLWLLVCGARKSFLRYTVDSQGICIHQLPCNRRIPWWNVSGFASVTPLRVVVGRTRVVLSRDGQFIDEHFDEIYRLWRRGLRGSGRRTLPLIDEAIVVWITAAIASLIMGVPLAIGGLMAMPVLFPIGGLLTLGGVLLIIRAVACRTRRICLTNTGLVDRMLGIERVIPWQDVFAVSCESRGIHGPEARHQLRVETVGRTIRFFVRPEEVQRVDRWLLRMATWAFAVDDASGEVRSPSRIDLEEIRSRLRRLIKRKTPGYLFAILISVAVATGFMFLMRHWGAHLFLDVLLAPIAVAFIVRYLTFRHSCRRFERLVMHTSADRPLALRVGGPYADLSEETCDREK